MDNIKKNFGAVNVLNGLDLSVFPGEFITLLGSSGCGKTTTLRVVAGLERPDEGRVWLADRDVTELEPNRRDVNTVFQNYALFPHLNVESNVGYSLRIKRWSKLKIKEAVQEALRLVQMDGYEKRMPSELSGGQKQRVAIARAVVSSPKILLLDEPLGALDLQLRRQMQTELKRLQKQLGITFIYITHDQEEALNMSDRIAVMRNGLFEQIGSASEIYDKPRTAYVARFVGSANIFKGVSRECKCEPGVTIAIRSENLQFIAKDAKASPGSSVEQGLSAVITDKRFAGGQLRISAVLEMEGGGEVTASRHGLDSPLQPGQRVNICWEPRHAMLVAEDDEP